MAQNVLTRWLHIPTTNTKNSSTGQLLLDSTSTRTMTENGNFEEEDKDYNAEEDIELPVPRLREERPKRDLKRKRVEVEEKEEGEISDDGEDDEEEDEIGPEDNGKFNSAQPSYKAFKTKMKQILEIYSAKEKILQNEILYKNNVNFFSHKESFEWVTVYSEITTKIGEYNLSMPDEANIEDIERLIMSVLNKYMVLTIFEGSTLYCILEWNDEFQKIKWQTYSKREFLDVMGNKIIDYPVKKVVKSKDTGKYIKKIEIKSTDLGKFWLTSPFRRDIKKIIFEPDMNTFPHKNSSVNFWTGYRFDFETRDRNRRVAKRKEEKLEKLYEENCTLVREVLHLQSEILNCSTEQWQFWLNWWAMIYQKPGEKVPVAIILYSEKQRVGKGWSFNTNAFGLGDLYATTTDKRDLVGQFGKIHVFRKFVFLDEA